jgi:phage tail-like protein
MEGCITHDQGFGLWTNKMHSNGGDSLMDLASFKRELMLEVMTEKGHVVHRYFLHNAWVSEYTVIPDFEDNANAIAIESLKLEIEGYDQDPRNQSLMRKGMFLNSKIEFKWGNV